MTFLKTQTIMTKNRLVVVCVWDGENVTTNVTEERFEVKEINVLCTNCNGNYTNVYTC